MKRQLMSFLSPPEREHAPTSFLMHQSSLSLFQDISDLETSEEEEEDYANATPFATSSRSPSPANHSEESDSTPSFLSPEYEFPTGSLSAASSPCSSSQARKRRRTANSKRSVQFDLSANVEHRPDSPRPIRRQDPSVLLRSPFKPTSILIRRPGDIPSPIPLHFSQTSQTSSTSQTFAYFAADRFSPSTTPSPSPELQLSPMARYSPEREPTSLPPAISVAASSMANSLGSLFSSSNPIALKPSGSTLAVEMNGERISLPMESFSQPSPSHSTLFDDLGFSTDQEQDDTVNSSMQKRPLADQSLARKRLRTDPSARRRGALSGTSATKDSSIPHRMPAMLRREASYGSGLQRSSNSSSIDLSAFFGPEQQERPSSPLKHEVAQDNTSPHNSDDHSMVL